MPHGDSLGPVVIGAREIYDAVVRVGNAVERLTDGHADIKATVDEQTEQLRPLAGLPEQVRDHEGRIRALEEAQPARRLGWLEQQVETLKASRWPIPALTALIAIAALLYTVLGPKS